MQVFRFFLVMVVIGTASLGMPIQPANAALPCNLNDIIHSTEFSDEVSSQIVQKTMVEAFAGSEPADRSGAEPVTSDAPEALRFNLISAGENILRCLDDRQDEVLVWNATPEFRYDRFGITDEIPKIDLISDLDVSDVYTGSVHNPLKLADGRFTVEFTARHNDLWLTGEMVFEQHDGDFYLSDTFLTKIESTTGEQHQVTVSENGVSDEEMTVSILDTIAFENELEENIRITVTSDDNGEVVFGGNNLGKGFEGPTPKYVFFVSNILEPGEYTAIITTDSGETYQVQISVEP